VYSISSRALPLLPWCLQARCNDVWAILGAYGVEAARAAIVAEVSAVFGAYGIAVDPRHLSLIADYMTYEGGYKPLSRIGMASSTSPLLKMSFETTIGFLTNSAIAAEVDPLTSPAANIVVGKPVRSGTGAFELLHPIPAIRS
jgi:DNA-directed RNA polymerase I subunit RPA1